MIIIGIGGQKESGKSTFAECLETSIRNQGRYVINTAFADPLYDVCQELYGWAGFKSKVWYDHNKGDKEVPLDKEPRRRTPRQILIDVGEALKNDQDEDCFVNATLDWLLKYPKDSVGIISDVRYRQELNALQRHNAHTLYVTRPGLPEPTFPDNLLDPTIDFDYIIENDSDLDRLQYEADCMSERLW